jgi:predicted DNA-binding transcriptional regulator YafY
VIADAVWDDRCVRARYRRGDGEPPREVVRELEPYGLVLKAGVWYLCARVREESRGNGVFRTYRIDRFVGVEDLKDHFSRDEEFDLPGFWGEQAERFARSILRDEVVLRLSEAGVRGLAHAVDPVAARDALASAGEADGRGWVTVALRVESQDVAHTQLTALGAEAEVISPESLRKRFAEDAVRLTELYRRG